MFYGEGTQIKLFAFYNSGSMIGDRERKNAEDKVNEFLKEYERNVIKVELSNDIIMVVYRANEY